MNRISYSLLIASLTTAVACADSLSNATASPDPASGEETKDAPLDASSDSSNTAPEEDAAEPGKLPDLSEEQIEERIAILAERQDELSAIIQDLSWKWADQKIVKFLEEVDYALLDARDALDEEKLGGETIAAQNDAIEKIYQAAKENQKSSGDSSLGAMMDQLDYMTGKKSGKSGQGKPGEEGDQPGQGGGGSGAEDDGIAQAGVVDKTLLENRTIPKATGKAPSPIPSEFREGMEALRESLAYESE